MMSVLPFYSYVLLIYCIYSLFHFLDCIYSDDGSITESAKYLVHLAYDLATSSFLVLHLNSILCHGKPNPQELRSAI